MFGIHGAGGTLGALLTGVFATRAINPIFKDAAGQPLPVGLLDGNAAQMLNQLGGIAIAMIVAVVGSFIILKVVDLIVGVRVSAEDELTGLDVTQHGEEGYDIGFDLTSAPSAFGSASASAQAARLVAQKVND